MNPAKLYKKHSIKYGSCNINMVNGKKKPSFPSGKAWQSPYDHTLKGFFVRLGEESNVCVLDLDNLENPTCKKLKVLAEACSNMTVRTKKGLHFYFTLDASMTAKKNCKEHDFDYLANGCIVFAAGCKYHDGEKEFTYKFVNYPDEDEQINSMSDSLKSELLSIFTEKSKPREKDYNKEVKKEQKVVQKSNIQYTKLEDKDMAELLKSLNVKRSNNYNDWISCGLALKNDGYDYTLWNEFSKKSTKYVEGECYYNWTVMNPNNITCGTLIYWLKQDNYEAYNKMFSKVGKYDGKIDLSNKHEYNDNIMIKLLADDLKQLDDDFKENVASTKCFKYFNKFHVHLTNSNEYYLINKDRELEFLEKIDSSYSHLNKKSSKFIDLWKESEYRNRFRKQNFLPDQQAPNDILNTFTGFKYETDLENKDCDEELIKPLLDHLKFALNDEKQYEYVLKWIAHIRQNPSKKTNVAIVLYGIQGIGKNCIVDCFLNSIFKGYCASVSESDIDEKFNGIFESKLVICGDEIKGNSRHDADRLKDLITNPQVKINKKNINAYTLNNYSNWFFTTNHSVPMKIEESDRRYNLIEANTEIKPASYFKTLYSLIEQPEVLMALDTFLKSINLKDFNPTEFPKTDYKKQLILFNLPSYIQMIRDNACFYKNQTIKTRDLYNRSKEYAKSNKLTYAYTETRFALDMKKYFGKYWDHTDIGNVYIFPDNLENEVDKLIMAKI